MMSKSGVYIIGCSETNEKVCAASGRISTQSGTALEVMEKSQDREKNEKLISKVTASGHTSTVEHIFFNLAFENVSVVVEQFMIEFRLASFTVKSRRYVDFSDSGYYVPELKDELKEKYISHMNSLFSLYSELCENGIAKEDARFVLPYCFYSNFYCSLGGRELVNVLRAMLFGRGKNIKEIYELGKSLLFQCKEYAPGIFGNFESQYGKYNDFCDLSFIKRENKEKDILQNVEILSYTKNPEKIVSKCALIEKFGISSSESEAIISDEETRHKIIRAVMSSSRPRALENVSFTVRYNNVTLSTLTHFARHRIQSLNIPSLSSCDRGSYVIAPSISENKELLSKYIDAFDKTKALYDDLCENGYGESETVYCLLSGNTLDIVSTMNGRELKLFLKLRTCSRAQWEIRELATELLKQLRKISPELFTFYGPSCYTDGFCPEGRLTCGKMKEIKEYFSSL